MASLKPQETELCRSRGDTEPMVFTIKDGDGNVIDVSGWSFLFTVDPAPDPTTTANNLFQLTGSFVTDGTDGQVQFEPSAVEMDQTPDTYFYDLQRTDGAGKIRTLMKGSFIVLPDITK